MNEHSRTEQQHKTISHPFYPDSEFAERLWQRFVEASRRKNDEREYECERKAP